MARFVTGTLTQLAGKISINGFTPAYNELTTLSRMFPTMFRQVGVIKKASGAGTPAVIWQVDTSKGGIARVKVNGTQKASGLVASNHRSLPLRKAA